MSKTAGDFISEIHNENTDCFECRFISSVGLLFSGLFLLQHRRNFGRVNAIFQTAFGTGLVFLSITRAMDFPPFGKYGIKGERYESPRNEFDDVKEK